MFFGSDLFLGELIWDGIFESSVLAYWDPLK